MPEKHYRIPWIWGNTWERDHVNQWIATNLELPRNLSPSTVGPPFDGGVNYYDKDPGFVSDEPLDAIMQLLWRVKTFTVSYGFAMSGTIDLFSHAIGEHTPWSISFTGEFTVTRDFFQSPPFVGPILRLPVDDERHHFGKFNGSHGLPGTLPLRISPLHSDEFGMMTGNPATASILMTHRAGFTDNYFDLMRGLNWDSTIKQLQVIAHTVDFSGVPPDLAMPYRFSDLRDFYDPDNPTVVIVSAGLNTEGQANPAHPCGDATLTIPTYTVGVGDDEHEVGGLDITRKCYRLLDAVTNRGFTIDSEAVGFIDVAASAFHPFKNRNGKEVYDSATGQLKDTDPPEDDGHGGIKKISPFD